jgi:hemolysin activation/secretion protein
MSTRLSQTLAIRTSCILFFSILVLGQPPALAQTITRGALPSEAFPRTPEGRTSPQQPIEPAAPLPSVILPDQAIPPGAESAAFVLGDLRVEGVTAYSAGDLQPFYRDLIGSRVSLDQLFGVAREIEAKYRADGYILTRAIVPAQTIEAGVFRIDVVEGFVSDVLVEGDIGPVRKQVLAYLEKVTTYRPVNIRNLERYLLLANDIPGMRVRARFRPAEGQLGGAVMIVAAERKKADLYGEVNNRGSEFAGPVQGLVQGGLNSFTPLGERAQITALGTSELDELKFIELAGETRFGSEGLTVRGFASYAAGEPGGDLERLQIESEAVRLGISAQYPLVRTRRFSFFLKAGFDVSNLELEASNQRLIKDKLRVLSAGMSGSYSDSFAGVTSAELVIRQGLKMFGATDDDDPFRSRANGRADFTKIAFEASRLQGLVSDFGLFLGAKGQYAFDSLLADEEITLGGSRFGRGFDPAELAGSHGLAGTIELQYSPQVGRELVDSWQLYAFYDVGAVWSDNDGPTNRRSLSSAGIGVRSNVTKWLYVNLEATKPLHTPAGAEASMQFFFGVAARY